MTIDLVKYRTLIGVLVAIGALLGGLALLAVDQRGAAYGAFSLAVVGVVGSLAMKGGVGVLANGNGLKGAKAALMTEAKPGEPPAAGGAP